MRDQGRINSDVSERSYRDALLLLAESVGNRDPRTIERGDVKKWLRRWPNANTKSKRLSYSISFFDWLMQEGPDYGSGRKDNPARQVTPPKRKPPQVYRLTF